MNKLTLKELDETREHNYKLFIKYFHNFINKKFNFNLFIDNFKWGPIEKNNVTLWVNCNKLGSHHFEIHYNVLYKKIDVVYLIGYSQGYIFKLYNSLENDFKPNFDGIKEKSKEAQMEAIVFFSKLENIKEFCEYVYNIYTLLYDTQYLYSLPLAYTFLLCNKKTNTFPKDIAKLIGEKILFFN
jgi:hypothetical protein